MAERDATEDELKALEDAATERDASDEELADLELAASRPINAPEADETSISGTMYGPEERPHPLRGRNLPAAILSSLTGGIIPGPPGLRPREEEEDGAGLTLAQGVARNFGDEVAGAMAQTNTDLRALANEGPPDRLQETYTNTRDAFRTIVDRYREENPGTAFALSTLGGAATAPFSGTPAIVAEGMAAGLGNARELDNLAVRDMLVGGALSYAGKQVGDIAGILGGNVFSRGAQRAGEHVAAAESKAREMAAEKVASEIASAKGKLGATTQEANRAVENLLRLESTGGLSSEQQAALAILRRNGTLPALQQKLADSMLEQVPGAAGRVDIARSMMEGLTERAPQATEEGASAILSGEEAKRQVGERLKRYLPTIAGSMMGAGPGGVAGYMLGGSPTEALIGALAGAGVRPAVRAGQRMLAHPAVQRGMYAPIQSMAEGAANMSENALPALGARIGMNVAPVVVDQSPAQQSTSDFVGTAMRTNPELLGSYAPMVENAMAQGNLPILHYRLMQTDPAYREQLEQARKAMR